MPIPSVRWFFAPKKIDFAAPIIRLGQSVDLEGGATEAARQDVIDAALELYDAQQQHAVNRSVSSARHDGVIVSWCGRNFVLRECAPSSDRNSVCLRCLQALKKFGEATDEQLELIAKLEAGEPEAVAPSVVDEVLVE